MALCGLGTAGWVCLESSSTSLSLQPGAPNVLEQGPERRNCHTTRVQLVSRAGPTGLPHVPLCTVTSLALLMSLCPIAPTAMAKQGGLCLPVHPLPSVPML